MSLKSVYCFVPTYPAVASMQLSIALLARAICSLASEHDAETYFAESDGSSYFALRPLVGSRLVLLLL